MKISAIVTALATVSVAFAFRPELAGTMAFWGAVAGPYAVLAALAAFLLHREDRLFELLRPRPGDLAMGVAVGAALLVASWAARITLAPSGTPQHAWLLNVYLQVGDPEAVQSSAVLTALLLFVVICEELVWRGWIQAQTTQALGDRRGWIASTLLYGATLTPTIVTLRAPEAGPNPLLFVAALFCGLVWSFFARVVGRLPPVIVSHAMFTYFSIVQFREPGL